VTDNSVIVSWSTADYAYGQVNFGTSSTSLLDKESNSEPGTSDSVSLVSLASGTVYHLKVDVFNVAGTKVESNMINFTTAGVNTTDSDGDGVYDINDAFPNDPNETTDTDGDGVGNSTDIDDDGDSVMDSEDAFPLDPDESLDTDTDTIGNNTDLDDDGDTVLDTDDAFPLDPDESIDTDNDGIGNNADLDDDGDGILDEDDSSPLDDAVGDSEAPVIGEVVNLVIEATGFTTEVLLEAPVVTDNNLNPATITSDYGGPLGLGEYEITWTAVDYANNSSVAIQIITIVDTTAPEFPEFPEINIDAHGVLTDISSYIDQIAVDLVDGEIAVTIEDQNSYLSGQQTVQISATDLSGNTNSAVLIVNINPIARLGLDKNVEAGSTINIPVYLSGEAAIYPVNIGYSITGNAVTNVTGDIIIEDGLEGNIKVNISALAVNNDDAQIILTTATHAIPEIDNLVTYTVTEINYKTAR